MKSRHRRSRRITRRRSGRFGGEAFEYSRKLFANARLVKAYFDHLRTILPVAAHEVLLDEEVVEERQQWRSRWLHRLMHGWLLVHVPLSFAFLVLTLVHAVVALRYGSL